MIPKKMLEPPKYALHEVAVIAAPMYLQRRNVAGKLVVIREVIPSAPRPKYRVSFRDEPDVPHIICFEGDLGKYREMKKETVYDE